MEQVPAWLAGIFSTEYPPRAGQETVPSIPQESEAWQLMDAIQIETTELVPQSRQVFHLGHNTRLRAKMTFAQTTQLFLFSLFLPSHPVV